MYIYMYIYYTYIYIYKLCDTDALCGLPKPSQQSDVPQTSCTTSCGVVFHILKDDTNTSQFTCAMVNLRFPTKVNVTHNARSCSASTVCVHIYI